MIKYKLATVKEASGIAKLLQKKYGRYYRPTKFTPQFVKERLKRKEVFYVVTIEDKKIVGTIRATKVDIDLVEFRHEVFSDLKIGKGLIKKMLSILKKKRMRKVVARTISTDRLNNRVYRGLRFRKEGYFKDHYRKGTHIIQYARFLR
ncbi:MAG: hypothetical protein IB618_01600 [Candidatus Pacearchaeota archaeon]|nr:MAG: hypothetical protein IB618_01600 [Candidatus Pacearchaeota archaeon]